MMSGFRASVSRLGQVVWSFSSEMVFYVSLLMTIFVLLYQIVVVAVYMLFYQICTIVH